MIENNKTNPEKTDKNGEDTSLLITNEQPTTNNQLEHWDKKHKEINKRIVKLEQGKSISTFNGGEIQPIMYKFVNAGEKIEKWSINWLARVLSAKVPTTDALYITFRAFFVPHSWNVENYDELKANKDDFDRSIDSRLPTVQLNATSTKQPLWGTFQNTYAFKKKTIAQFVPYNINKNIGISALLTRTYHESWNHFIRNKLYQPSTPRFTEQEVTAEEKRLICGEFDNDGNPVALQPDEIPTYGWLQRDQVRRGYYTNIIPSLQAIDLKLIPDAAGMISQGENEAILNKNEFTSDVNNFWGDPLAFQGGRIFPVDHIDWQSKVDEYKRRVTEAPLNDWDIIAKLGGTTAVKTDRPMYLGDMSCKLNYQQITQTATNNNDNKQSPLGTTGAYSVTMETGETLFGHKEFLQDGIIMITATVQSDNTFEEAVHRTAMITDTTQMTMPTLRVLETDFLLKAEVNATDQTIGTSPDGVTNVISFKEKYSEWRTLPNLCQRDARTQQPILTPDGNQDRIPSISQWHNMKSNDDETSITATYRYFSDYDTEELIARNSLLTTINYASQDQILLACDHDVRMKIIDTPVKEKYGTERKGLKE